MVPRNREEFDAQQIQAEFNDRIAFTFEIIGGMILFLALFGFIYVLMAQ